MFNLLADPLIRAEPLGPLTLPGVLAALARGGVRSFPALRPHQRAAWHMFTVQLGVLAAERGGLDGLPGDEGAWAGALSALTPDWGDDPWRLAVADAARPAFLQPPDPGGLKWTEVPTPDALDMLITSKNHDLKQEVARQAAPEDWVFALVTLQTMEGYGGAGNHGVARMNGGSSSRAMLGLAPRDGSGGAGASARWRRDVLLLLRERRDREPVLGQVGGPALLWCLPWPEGRQLAPSALDPFFIEVCRRVRLDAGPNGLVARRATSAAARLDAKAYNGVLGDPWAPVNVAQGKSLTLSNKDFDYRLLCDLLFSGDWKRPLLAWPAPGEDASGMVLVAEALARGNSRTDGLKSRTIPLPKDTSAFDTAAAVAADLVREVETTDDALRRAIALYAAGGDRDKVKKAHRARAADASARLQAEADALFFPALWERLEARLAGDEAEPRRRFRAALVAAARAELEAAFEAVPVAGLFAPRARVRARGFLQGLLAKGGLIEPAAEPQAPEEAPHVG